VSAARLIAEGQPAALYGTSRASVSFSKNGVPLQAIRCVRVAAVLNGLDAVDERLFQGPLGDGCEQARRNDPLMFLPSQIMTTSTSVVPLGWRVRVYL
jgi:hypothetical protein